MKITTSNNSALVKPITTVLQFGCSAFDKKKKKDHCSKGGLEPDGHARPQGSTEGKYFCHLCLPHSDMAPRGNIKNGLEAENANLEIVVSGTDITDPLLAGFALRKSCKQAAPDR